MSYRKNQNKIAKPKKDQEHEEQTGLFGSDADDDLPWDSLAPTTATPKSPTGGGYSTGYTSTGPRCHESHKEIALGGGTLLGASGNYPRPGFDVYVGFDWGTKLRSPKPWCPAEQDDGAVYAKFEITDGSVPKDKAEFDLMLQYLIDQLAAGKRVHIGCIGGHGRTGLVIAALVAKINGEKDAIQWVREHHCKKAVETKVQVDWLMKHYGVSEATGSKAGSWGTGSFSGKYGGTGGTGGMGFSGKGGGGKTVSRSDFGTKRTDLREGSEVSPLSSPASLFPALT